MFTIPILHCTFGKSKLALALQVIFLSETLLLVGKYYLYSLSITKRAKNTKMKRPRFAI